MNLVVVGDHSRIVGCFGSRWDETESISLKTCVRTARAFLFDSEYRYSPISPLFYHGRQQEIALQMARANINERIHLRLWRTPLAHQWQQVWIGQISRDIGVRLTLKTWNLTTHKIDPDVDDARGYLMGCLLAVGRVAKLGYAEGVEKIAMGLTLGGGQKTVDMTTRDRRHQIALRDRATICRSVKGFVHCRCESDACCLP